MELVVGNDNYLPFDTEDEEELLNTYDETLSALGDLLYYGRGYSVAVNSIEVVFDREIEYLTDGILSTDNVGTYKKDILDIIDIITENIMFPFCLKCVKPMNNFKYVDTIYKFIEKDVYNKLGVFDDDTIDFAYRLIDKIVEELDGSVEYSDNYKKYLDILHKRANINNI